MSIFWYMTFHIIYKESNDYMKIIIFDIDGVLNPFYFLRAHDKW